MTWCVAWLAITTGVICPSKSLADQADPVVDVILLRNGATIKGTIKEIIPGKQIVIERRDGMIFEIPVEKIAALTDLDHLAERRRELKTITPQINLITGWENVTVIGFRHGEGDTYFSFSATNGALIGKHIYLGLGVGWDNYPSGDMVPIFANVRYFFDVKPVRPFFTTEFSYSLGWLDSQSGANYGGLTLSVGLGTKLIFTAESDASPIVQIGYRLQRVKEMDRSGDRVSNTFHFMTVMVGIAF